MKILSVPLSVVLAALGVPAGIFACLVIALSIVALIPLPSVIAFEISIVIIGMISGYISKAIAASGGKIRMTLSSAWNIGFCAGATSRGVAWLQTKQLDADMSTIMVIAPLVFGIAIVYATSSARRKGSDDRYDAA